MEFGSDRPLIAMTPWRLDMATFVHPVTDLYTIDTHYTAAIEQAGGNCAVLPWIAEPWIADRAELDAEAARRLVPFAALMLTGGQDMNPSLYGQANSGSLETRRAGDESDMAFVRAAISQGKPILGICRGQQVINVALGGSLIQHIWESSPDHPSRPASDDETRDAESFLANRHQVELSEGSHIRRLAGSAKVEVNSLHHQSIDQVGDGLRVTGRAPDGVIEAMEHSSHPLVSVQWHPERLDDNLSRALFSWLVQTSS